MTSTLSCNTRSAVLEALNLDADSTISDQFLGRKLYDTYYSACHLNPDAILNATSLEELKSKAERAKHLGELYDMLVAETRS